MSKTIARETHDVINALSRLAGQIDPEYSEMCLDTVMTMRAPQTPAERLVFEMHSVAFMLNATAEDLSEGNVRFIDYRNA